MNINDAEGNSEVEIVIRKDQNLGCVALKYIHLFNC